MKNWKTTIGGIVVACGAACQLSDNPTVKIIGWVLVTCGSVFFGVNAGDATAK